MRVIRTAVAVGALALSVPVYAQAGRGDSNSSKTEQRQGGRGGDRGGDRGESRGSGSAGARSGQRPERRTAPRAESRPTFRGESRPSPWNETRARGNDVWSRRGDGRDDRADRGRYDPRVTEWVRDRRGYDDRSYGYRAYDLDRGRRERTVIGWWFRGHGGLSISVRSHLYGRDRYDFRRGVYLSSVVVSRLELLPFDLELELGDLPPYCERRMYGQTVLVIDMRTMLVIDAYDVEW